MKLLDMRNWSPERREAASGYLLIAPWIIGFLLLTLIPMAASLYFSFTDYNIVSTPVWVGLDNYARLLRDPKFWQSLKVTLTYAGLSLPASLVFGLLLAVLLNQKIPFVRFWRTLYFLPSVLAGVATTLLWTLLLNPQFGVVNAVLEAVGIDGPGWLTDPAWALPSLALMALWGVGQTMIIYLSGLQGIPTELHDAARVDGATDWRRFLHVTLPMMSPVIFYNLVLGLIGTFSYFTQAYIVGSTGDGGLGAPLRSTLFYNLYLYETAFSYFEMGYASALAWVLFAVVLVLTVLIFRSSSLWVYYEGELRSRT